MLNKILQSLGLLVVLAASFTSLWKLVSWGVGSVQGEDVVHTTTTLVNVQQLDPLTNTTTSATREIKHLELKGQSVVFLEGQVGPNAHTIAADILENSVAGRPTYLVIDSPGGSVLDGAQVLSAIEASKTPVYTICKVMCASMAAIIHQFGTKRMMVDRSVLMFHDAAGGVQGTVPQMKTLVDFIDGYVTKMDAHIAKRSGQTLQEFMAKMGPNVWIDAEDALKAKYADEIVSITTPELIHILGNFGGQRNREYKRFRINWEMPFQEEIQWNTY